jgi:cell division protein FtsB
MVTLEQIRLLESKIVKAIAVVNQLNEENVRLKRRNEELEELAERLRDEKSRVEAGIVSALERLNQFEDAIERSLSSVKQAETGFPPEARPPVSSEAPEPPAAPPAAAQPVPDQGPALSVPSTYMVDEEEPEEIDGEELDIF